MFVNKCYFLQLSLKMKAIFLVQQKRALVITFSLGLNQANFVVLGHP